MENSEPQGIPIVKEENSEFQRWGRWLEFLKFQNVRLNKFAKALPSTQRLLIDSRLRIQSFQLFCGLYLLSSLSLVMAKPPGSIASPFLASYFLHFSPFLSLVTPLFVLKTKMAISSLRKKRLLFFKPCPCVCDIHKISHKTTMSPPLGKLIHRKMNDLIKESK